jgi:hypothetical protein
MSKVREGPFIHRFDTYKKNLREQVFILRLLIRVNKNYLAVV